MGNAKMALERYVERTAFPPEALRAMGEAFDGVLKALDIGPEEEVKRKTIAQIIIRLAQADESLDATSLRDRAIKALEG
jgi:hypothetical protein